MRVGSTCRRGNVPATGTDPVADLASDGEYGGALNEGVGPAVPAGYRQVYS